MSGPITPIRAEISGDDRCEPRRHRPLTVAGPGIVQGAGRRRPNPALSLQAFRGDTLCLTVRSIGEAARLEINAQGTDFIPHRARRAASPMRQSGVPATGVPLPSHGARCNTTMRLRYERRGAASAIRRRGVAERSRPFATPREVSGSTGLQDRRSLTGRGPASYRGCFPAARCRLDELRRWSNGRTADEIANSLRRSILSIRPRVSELHAAGKISPRTRGA